MTAPNSREALTPDEDRLVTMAGGEAQIGRLGWTWRADAAGRIRWVRDDRE